VKGALLKEMTLTNTDEAVGKEVSKPESEGALSKEIKTSTATDETVVITISKPEETPEKLSPAPRRRSSSLSPAKRKAVKSSLLKELKNSASTQDDPAPSLPSATSDEASPNLADSAKTRRKKLGKKLSRDSSVDSGGSDIESKHSKKGKRKMKKTKSIDTENIEEEHDKTILVYDFGGGTFDASLLQVTDGAIEVLAIDGDSNLGGADVTKILSEQIIYEEFVDVHDTDMFDQEESGLSDLDFIKNKQAIEAAAEQAKIELSDYDSAENASL
jgi:hypothetical protein